MRIEIFTEDSGTTADRDEIEQVDEYFKGRFRNAENFADELEKFGTVNTHILSDKYGYILGSDPVSNLDDGDHQESHNEFGQTILEAAESADVIVILLTSAKFKQIVTSRWDGIVNNTKKDSIWCIGVSQSAISSVDIDELRSVSQKVIFYERVGVARISSEYKNELFDTLSELNSR